MSPARDLEREVQALLQEQRRLEVALERSEARLRTAQELAHLGTYEIGIPAGPDDYWSDGMYRLTGVAPGRPPLDPRAFVAEVVHAEDRARVAAEIERVVAEGTPFDFDCRLCRPDGSVRRSRASAGRSATPAAAS